MNPSTTTRPEWRCRTTDAIFAPVEETPPLVSGLALYSGCATLLAGPGHSGKTMLAQALALSAAAGTSLFGKVPRPLRVLHLDREQYANVTDRRYQSLAAGNGIRREQVGDRLVVIEDPPVLLDSPVAPAEYGPQLAGFDLVIIDSLRAFAPSLDENDSRIRMALDPLGKIASDNKQCILVIAHAKKGAGKGDPQDAVRGSSAIFDAFTSAYLIRSKSRTRKVLANIKDRLRARHPDWQIEISSVGSSSIRTEPFQDLHAEAWRKAMADTPLTKAQARVLQTLEEQGPAASKTKLANSAGGNKSTTLQAITELVEKGVIVVSGDTHSLTTKSVR